MNGFLSSIVSWLRAGYPEGIPPTDTFAVLALLTRRLGNDEVKIVAHELMQRDDFDDVDIGVLINKLTDEMPIGGGHRAGTRTVGRQGLAAR